MGQAIDNLLLNAIKYFPGGGHITIIARHTPESIAVEVTDTAAIPGAGLGPVIPKKILEAHHGSITHHQ